MPRVGILGGGQLARMIALAGHPLGISSTVLDPSPRPCAAAVCQHLRGEYDDYAALFQVVQASDLITYEFENVPVEAARWLAERCPVYPPPQALEVSQDRLREKTFFQQLGIPTAPFAPVQTRDDLNRALAEIGFPAVLKTCRFGYDGKGQAVMRTPAEVEVAWQKLAGRPLILEGFIPFDRELSLIAARSVRGEVVCYPLIENEHRDGILHRSIAPASHTGEELNERAQDYMLRVLSELGYVGVLTLEWFQEGPRLIANEMAPRVHNSGHWTIEGAETSQFENHLRAILDLPLGSTAPRGSSAMFNFIGKLPFAEQVLSCPQAHFHDYGKEPRPGRKVGHVTLRAESRDELEALLPAWSTQFDRQK